MLKDRCVIGVDVKAYSQRNPRRQADTQRDLALVLSEAAHVAGLDRSDWDLFPTGDDELAVLPADVDLLPVVAKLVPALHELLVLRNSDRVPATQIRLRMAVHIDALTPGSPGNYAGTALVTVSRLLDSAPVRAALTRADDAMLAVILSTPVYEKVVLSGFVTWGDHAFVPVAVELPAKKFSHDAYLHVPGHDMRSFAASAAPSAERTGSEAGPAAAAPAPAAPSSTSTDDGPAPAAAPAGSTMFGTVNDGVHGGTFVQGDVHNSGTFAGRDIHNR
jgi:hypothetical protein